MNKGYVHVYTGNGKGKTTCILGLTLRASGAEKSVYIGQFMKRGDYSEVKAIRNYLPQVTLIQHGSGKGFVRKGEGTEEDKYLAKKGVDEAINSLKSNKYDIVILDEINVAVFLEVLDESDIFKIIDSKPLETELILTGRYATEGVINKADLVTEMKEIKHYFNEGVVSRIGIEQ